MSEALCKGNTGYFLNYIGNDEDMKTEEFFKSFDTNYINLDLLPFNFYPIYNSHFYDKYINRNFQVISGSATPTPEQLIIIKDIKDEFETRYKDMKDQKAIYNRYLITPISITITLIWIFIILFILKYIHYNYTILYIYIISTIIIILLIFGSFWFLYVNSQLL